MVEVIWGRISKFGDSDSKRYMVYYGILIRNTFLGIGVLVSKASPPKIRADQIHKRWNHGYCRSEL